MTPSNHPTDVSICSELCVERFRVPAIRSRKAIVGTPRPWKRGPGSPMVSEWPVRGVYASGRGVPRPLRVGRSHGYVDRPNRRTGAAREHAAGHRAGRVVPRRPPHRIHRARRRTELDCRCAVQWWRRASPVRGCRRPQFRRLVARRTLRLCESRRAESPCAYPAGLARGQAVHRASATRKGRSSTSPQTASGSRNSTGIGRSLAVDRRQINAEGRLATAALGAGTFGLESHESQRMLALEHIMPTGIQRVSIADGRIRTVVAFDSGGIDGATLSPDERQLAYIRLRDGVTQLVVSDTSSGNADCSGGWRPRRHGVVAHRSAHRLCDEPNRHPRRRGGVEKGA